MKYRIPFSLALCCHLFSQESKVLPMQSSQTAPPKIYYYGPDYGDFYTEVDAIIWQPYTEDALAWVDVRTYAIHSGSEARYQDDLKSMKYGWEAGFRVASGYRFGENDTGAAIRPWQIEANYTQFINHAMDAVPAQVGASGTNFVVTPLVPAVTVVGIAYVSGSSAIDLSYRHLKTQFAWPIWVSENVIWRLMTGASYAWFHNTWNSIYSTVPVGSSVVGIRGNDYTDFSWKFAGGGLLAATDFHMEVGAGFGFFATGSLDLLVGRLSLDERYRQLSQADSSEEEQPIDHTDDNYHRTFTRFQPAFSFGAGLDYKHWFIPKSFMAYISAGYEWMLWVNLNQFGKVNERGDATVTNTSILSTTLGNFFDAEPSSLGFQGATVRFGLEF